MKKFSPLERPNGEILKAALFALKNIRPQILNAIRCETGLRHPTQTMPNGETKQMLAVDQMAEDKCIEILTGCLGHENICVLGEETLWPGQFKSLDLSTQHMEGYGENTRIVDGPEKRIVAIVDMLDGSDLVERNFGNWCSAMIFFMPGSSPRILFSLVQQADGKIYGADPEGTFLLQPNSNGFEHLGSLNGPQVRKLEREEREIALREETQQIAICFYGQKFDSFAALPEKFHSWIKSNPARKRIRIYNFAGNPMMVRLANGEEVHAVFEHRGQNPHDAAPGAYIGAQGGACLLDFAGNVISPASLAAKLMRPSGEKIRYILASTPALGFHLAKVLN